MKTFIKQHIKLFVLMILSLMSLAGVSMAGEKKVVIDNLTTPFGTPLYLASSSFEQIFDKADSFVSWKAKETPGAMYVVRSFFENKAAMVSGEKNQIITGTSAAVLGHINEARPPFNKFKNMEMRAIISSSAFIYFFSTFDSSIKQVEDLAGKKVGVAEKPRVFGGTLLHKPYFQKGLNLWDKVKWQTIGVVNSKNALLNNKIDAQNSVFLGEVEIGEDGMLICNKIAPSTTTMELMNSGKKLHLLDNDPEIIKKSYDFNVDMRVMPVLVKKGAHKSIEKDMWGRCIIGLFVVHKSMPDDVVKEIIRVRYDYHSDLTKYHAALKFYSKNPYPLGVPEKWIHPGVKKAMKALNIPIP